MIRLQDVNKEYESKGIRTLAVKNVTLEINKGDFIAIVGPSGSGKSTLMKLVSGVMKATSGEIYYMEHNISKLDKDVLAQIRGKNFGQVFQDYRLIAHLNVLDNILLPIRIMGKKVTAAEIDKAQALLKKLGVENRDKHLPDKLSGGQKQRVAIARALINDPSVIFADEPTGNLDIANTNEIITILKGLNEEGITVVVVTHDSEVSSAAGRVIQFEGGQATYLQNAAPIN